MGNKFGDAYREEQRRIHREALRPRRPRWERQQEDRRAGGGGAIARGIAAAGIIGAVHASANSPGQADTSTFNYWQQSEQRREEERRSRELDEGTRDSGYSAGWSGENY
jgi:hypothetical protein